jgi:hypothetical protein
LVTAEESPVFTLSCLRPDGSVALTTTSPFTGFPRNGYLTYNFNLNLDVVGAWKIELKINDQVLANAPFSVVAPGSPVVNHAPAVIEAAFDPVSPTFSDTPFCRITSSTLFSTQIMISFATTISGKSTAPSFATSSALAWPMRFRAIRSTLTTTSPVPSHRATAQLMGLPRQSQQLCWSASHSQHLHRLNVGTGGSVLIGGFIITGSDPKKS